MLLLLLLSPLLLVQLLLLLLPPEVLQMLPWYPGLLLPKLTAYSLLVVGRRMKVLLLLLL